MDVLSCQNSPPYNKDGALRSHVNLGLADKGLVHSPGPWPFAHLSEALNGLRPEVVLGSTGRTFNKNFGIDGGEHDTVRRVEHMNSIDGGEHDIVRRVEHMNSISHPVVSVSWIAGARECLNQSALDDRHSVKCPSMDFSRSTTEDNSFKKCYDSALIRGTAKVMQTYSDLYTAQGAEETRTLTAMIDIERRVPANYDMPCPRVRVPMKLKKKNVLENPWEYGLSMHPIPNMVSGRQLLQCKSSKPSLELVFSRPSASCKLTLKKLPLRTSQMQFKVATNEIVDGKIGTLEKRKKGTQGARKCQLQSVHVLKQLLCGGVAGVISRSVVAPLDLIKTYLITSHGIPGSQKSALAVCKEIVDASGWQGLFRGNLVNCIRVAPSKAIELCVFETVRRELTKEGHPLKRVAATIAGGAAGLAGTAATYPLELIRTRLSVQPELYTGILQAVTKIFHDEGFLAFYSGLSPSLVGVFPYAATNYYVYDGLRTTYRRSTGRQNVPIIPTLAFGAVAAAISSTVTYPLEVARRQMQLSLTDAMKKSSVRIILEIYKHEGFLALYRGLGTTWLKLIPAAGISFVCYEAARLALCIDDASVVLKAKEASIPAERSGI